MSSDVTQLKFKTSDNVADALTKAMYGKKLTRCRRKVGSQSCSKLLPSGIFLPSLFPRNVSNSM
jgi:hypothetical protein